MREDQKRMRKCLQGAALLAGVCLLGYMWHKNDITRNALQEKNEKVLQVNEEKVEEILKQEQVIPANSPGVEIVDHIKRNNIEQIDRDLFYWHTANDRSMLDEERKKIWFENPSFFPCKLGENHWKLDVKSDPSEGKFQEGYVSDYGYVMYHLQEGEFEYELNIEDQGTDATLAQLGPAEDAVKSCQDLLDALDFSATSVPKMVKGNLWWDFSTGRVEVPSYVMMFERLVDGIPAINQGYYCTYTVNGLGAFKFRWNDMSGLVRPESRTTCVKQEDCFTGEDIVKKFKKYAKKSKNEDLYTQYELVNVRLVYEYEEGMKIGDGTFIPCWSLRVKKKQYDFTTCEWTESDSEYLYSVDGKREFLEDTFGFLIDIEDMEEVDLDDQA